jgi:hypothetical protein
MSSFLNFKPDAARLSKRLKLLLFTEEGMGKTSKCLQTTKSKVGLPIVISFICKSINLGLANLSLA